MWRYRFINNQHDMTPYGPDARYCAALQRGCAYQSELAGLSALSEIAGAG
jgi:hypothetical protein